MPQHIPQNGSWFSVGGFPMTPSPTYAYVDTSPALKKLGVPVDYSMDRVAGATLAGWMPWAEELAGERKDGSKNVLASRYVPSGIDKEHPPEAVVLVLHGCRQHSQAYAYGAGWVQLADKYKWVLLAPQQTYANQLRLCWSWYQPGADEGGVREATAINEMLETVQREYWGDDAPQAYVTGLSAGGAMTGVMVARYPKAFAGAAILAGLPYGSAADGLQALKFMERARVESPQDWAVMVREVTHHNGPWPRISLWHGTQDKTVDPGNLTQLIGQWTALHGTDSQTLAPCLPELVKGGHRHVKYGNSERPQVEAYWIEDMPHGVPVDDEGGDRKACGWVWPMGICASQRIAQFWGLVKARP